MNKKVWNLPEISSINIDKTEAGGKKPTQHDGKIYQINGIYVEEYKS